MNDNDGNGKPIVSMNNRPLRLKLGAWDYSNKYPIYNKMQTSATALRIIADVGLCFENHAPFPYL